MVAKMYLSLISSGWYVGYLHPILFHVFFVFDFPAWYLLAFDVFLFEQKIGFLDFSVSSIFQFFSSPSTLFLEWRLLELHAQ